MEIKFKIEPPVKSTVSQKYQLTVDFTHREDLYTTKTFLYDETTKGIKQLELDLIGVLLLNKLHIDNIDDIELIHLYEKQGLTSIEASDAEDSFKDKFKQVNHLNDFEDARLSSYHIDYFDKNCMSHRVSVWVNGKNI